MRLLSPSAKCSLARLTVRARAAGRPIDGLPAAPSYTGRPMSSHTLQKQQQPTVYRLPAEDGSVDLATQVRESMRLVAQPMAIVTTPVGGDEVTTGMAVSRQHQHQHQQRPLHGLVASSFNIVSMAAPGGPIVSFNLKLPSRTFAAISARGEFDVSFPYSADICRSFLGHPPSKPPGQAGKEGGSGEGSGPKHNESGAFSKKKNKKSTNQVLEQPKRPEQQAFESQMEHLLRLQRTFAYRCHWLQEQSITVADHIIMVGQVKEFLVGDTVTTGTVTAEKLPINYRDSKFLRLGSQHQSRGFFHFSIKEEML